MTTSGESTGARAFDFFVGRWTVRHRRLRERLAGSHDWVAFGGTAVMQKTLGGHGNMDDNVIELPGDTYCALTIRAFDPKASRWSIWWLDERHADRIEPPVHGGFDEGVGTFYGDDVYQGRPIRVRFLWNAITATSCRWEQAFSVDGGVSWEANWIMEFTRVN